MQVILLDKVANTGGTGDQVNVKAELRSVTSLVPTEPAVPAAKKNVEFSKHVVLNYDKLKRDSVLAAANARAEAINAHWVLYHRFREAGGEEVNCSVPSVPAISLMQFLQRALKCG